MATCNTFSEEKLKVVEMIHTLINMGTTAIIFLSAVERKTIKVDSKLMIFL